MILFLLQILSELVIRFLVCMRSHELVDGLEPNLHGYKIWAGWRLDLVMVTVPYFQDKAGLNRSKLCLCIWAISVFSEKNKSFY